MKRLFGTKPFGMVRAFRNQTVRCDLCYHATNATHRALMALAAIIPSVMGTFASPSAQVDRVERELEVQVRINPNTTGGM